MARYPMNEEIKKEIRVDLLQSLENYLMMKTHAFPQTDKLWDNGSNTRLHKDRKIVEFLSRVFSNIFILMYSYSY